MSYYSAVSTAAHWVLTQADFVGDAGRLQAYPLAASGSCTAGVGIVVRPRQRLLDDNFAVEGHQCVATGGQTTSRTQRHPLFEDLFHLRTDTPLLG